MQDKGELVMRAYTPTSTEADKGHFDLVVKVYWANEHPSFPDVRPNCDATSLSSFQNDESQAWLLW